MDAMGQEARQASSEEMHVREERERERSGHRRTGGEKARDGGLF
jgi:hypothetical protein